MNTTIEYISTHQTGALWVVITVLLIICFTLGESRRYWRRLYRSETEKRVNRESMISDLQAQLNAKVEENPYRGRTAGIVAQFQADCAQDKGRAEEAIAFLKSLTPAPAKEPQENPVVEFMKQALAESSAREAELRRRLFALLPAGEPTPVVTIPDPENARLRALLDSSPDEDDVEGQEINVLYRKAGFDPDENTEWESKVEAIIGKRQP